MKRDRDERREIEMKREERRNDFVEKCIKPRKSARRFSSTCFEQKSPSDEFFVEKFRILPVFSIIYMIRIAGINSE